LEIEQNTHKAAENALEVPFCASGGILEQVFVFIPRQIMIFLSESQIKAINW
jgi:hypothetical protein